MHSIQQLDLFDQSRWPRRPYCTDDLSTGLKIRSLRRAIEYPYIQANPPHLRCWSIYDVDRPGGGLAWEDAMLPPPSWAAISRDTGHAHLVYGLSAPVLVSSPDLRQKPLRYLYAVESLMREKLAADPGYAGLITKNPAHPLWWVLRGPRLAYDLGELAEWLPGLERHIPKRNRVEEIGLGRNVTLFNWLRHWAYRHIRHYKEGVRNFVIWQSVLNDKALERNADFAVPLDPREVWHVSRSVAKWVWTRFDVARSDRAFSELQGRRGAKVKKGTEELEKWAQSILSNGQ